MPLHPYFVAKIAPLHAISPVDLATPGALDDFMASTPGWEPAADVEIAERSVPGPHGPVPLRIYTSTAEFVTRTGLVWMHGGGFSSGTLDWPEAHVVAAELAHRTGAVVVSVDYRLAVAGVTYPTPLDDVVAAWTWFESNAAELGVTSGLFIGGGSAGANLAAATAMRLRDESERVPEAMLLAYGVFHFPVPGVGPEQQAELGALPNFMRATPEGHIQAFRNYVGNVFDVPPYAAPGNRNLRDMPTAYIVISELDELRASSETFATQLSEAGTVVRTHLAEGMLHGHLNWMPTAEVPEIEATVSFLAQALTRPPAR